MLGEISDTTNFEIDSIDRAYWHHWSGGNLFNMRGEGKGSGGFTIEFRKDFYRMIILI